MTSAQHDRYLRHTLLPQVGEEGQERLLNSSVLIIGCGGLGSPAALYLAAAGVGRIGLVDPDTVERSNLQRQVLFSESQVGEAKVTAAAKRLQELNPELRIDLHRERLTVANALDLAKDYDLILDGSDNFPTRYLTNDCAFFLKKPLIYGSIFQFDGQVTVFDPHREGPCYRCLLPDAPAADAVPNCAEAGVLGALPGVIGSLQAMEALKVLLGIGEAPHGKLVCYDALRSSFRTIKLRKNPDCILCGENPSLETLRYEGHSCPVNAPYSEITPDEFREMLAQGWDGVLLDVRTPEEYAERAIEGSYFLPLQEIPARIAEIPKDKPLVIHCKAGMRSARACMFLAENGYSDLTNLAGGIDAW
ncbi:molybdopterin-synthase adenylyltransferase MoeB [Roseibacillus persicicus]|uniref:molybdopterin-synthase adenylyltransferase MoeB n=1 Tax=Roseibacillus persicicus TaxID=454148 RepID=UPI00280F8DAB|nr:molybdopterin-synthase adenylyltransferase MoeB [Roseibacillus persicicus]MDQ8189914.1 molybdopterin-synthase adenylyltransferase MoeB [Roseibacillus persicicus]